MKITLHYLLAFSYSIISIISNQLLEARVIDNLDPEIAPRLESRAIRHLNAQSLRRRAIPHGIFHSCVGGGLSRVCEATIRGGWKAGKLKVITPDVRSFTDGTHPCKVTFWTDSGEVKLASVEQLLEAMLQIDDYCAAIDLPLATPCEDSSEYEGVFVGKLSGQHVVMRLEGMQ
ncbi:hypothetical protein PGT21_025095 [Puccinia graminis f. sp. tritici]|uniref:Uncharacterized protein n=1 Tax=Puccinia graminis f. sp. tritici TaxID=56615 RepID=A0A5B0PUA4_PUCGR|nr:hypothetical protein PGTUg99_021548 [Puccinia graminis f. sp. tritici]KAA1104496.1 hypothetical protein PGT21_025095 [Puccinia graminis f. sp. tritici]